MRAGDTVGPYRILDKLGEGGMGEVYRATDTRLKRAVAIKVLPEALAADGERLARFQREAEVLASLNHPNIAIVHGLEDVGSSKALVMELVEGPTLADQITEGRIPVEEALAIARQIAEALEAAHEQGIVHRDLKPANVKLRPDGTVKVLDFGLAKAMEPASAAGVSSSQTLSPTITTPAMTQAGMILGTAAYMSPEQAKGRPADRRSDLWAFGCVLYEMLTGRRAFEGEDVSETLASVLAREPDWSRLPPDVPQGVSAFLRRCLHRDPRQRVGDAQTLRLALEGAFDDTRPAAVREGGTSRSLWRSVLPVAAAFLVGAVGVAIVRGGSPAVDVVRSFIEGELVYGGVGGTLAMSPDGRTLVYQGDGRLLRRDLGQLEAVPLPGTEGGSGAFFSPDGASIGFVDATGRLRRVSLAGGPATTILNRQAPPLWSGTWCEGDVFLVARAFGVLYRVTGGDTVRPITTLGADDAWHMDPRCLPGGQAALFTVVGKDGSASVAVVALDGGEYRPLVEGAAVQYVPSGHLLFARDSSLWAVPFDLGRLELTGEPETVLEDVRAELFGSVLAVGGASGTLVYARESEARTDLRWTGRDGRPLGSAGVIDGRPFTFELDWEDRRLALGPSTVSELLVYDIERRTTSSLAVIGDDPNWSPDGRELAYAEGRMGTISVVPARGGQPRVVFERQDGGVAWLDDWSRTGNRLSVHLPGDVVRGVVISLDGASEPVQFAEAPSLDQSEFSPDGNWIAFNADRGNGQEVHVVPFPPTGEDYTVSSSTGGVQAQWSSDGTELFYLALDGTLMSVTVDTRTGFSAGAPTPLFESGLVPDAGVEQYGVASDGERFLLPMPVGDESGDSLVLVQNWFEELRRLVPVE